MTTEDSRMPRAVGRRIGFDGLPQRVRDWLTGKFGSARIVAEHVGGMSPGCATSLETSRAGMIFVKAVGAELNPQTPMLFRHEITVLGRLAPARYRPAMLATYDDGDWVAVALEHVAGRYPDLSTPEDFAAVARAVTAQSRELTPVPLGVDVSPLADTARRWQQRWHDIGEAPDRYLPSWAADRFAELLPRVVNLPDNLPGSTLCHFDIRDDNVLLRGDGEAMILDWGMARLGPSWTDHVLLAAQQPTAEQAQFWLERWIPSEEHETVTSLLLAFGGSQAWNAAQPPKESLPFLAAYTREDARRLLAIAQLRLIDPLPTSH